MAQKILRRYLEKIPVSVEDNSLNSPDYFGFDPDSLPGFFRLGINKIISKPNIDNLQINSEIEMEAIDGEGYALPFTVEGKIDSADKVVLNLRVSEDTPIYNLKLYFVGTLKGGSKVRWYRTFTVNREGVKFFGSPSGSLITGSFFIGRAPGRGMEMSGKRSSFIKSTDYQGFNLATGSQAPSGFIMFSGSVLPTSGDDYKGVGLELVSGNKHYFRFRSSPGALEIKTDNIDISGSNVKINTPSFFLGSRNPPAMLSGSNGILEISSSKFSLDVGGGISASAAVFQNSCKADMFIYRETKISPSGVNADNHLLNKYVYGSRNYIVLEMTGSSDYGGPDTGHFIRIQGLTGTYSPLAEEYPIGAINIAGPGDNKYVSFIMIENAMGSGNKLYFAHGKTHPAGGNIEILKSDTDDWTEKSWNQTTASAEGAYSGLLALDHGARLLFYKSEFDWRIQSTSEYNHIAPSFYSGSHHGNTSQTTAINAYGDIDVTSGNIYTTGNISASGHISASSGHFGTISTTVADNIFTSGHITASGNLEVAGDISGSSLATFQSLRLDYDSLPTSDPAVAGVIYINPSDNSLHISQGG